MTQLQQLGGGTVLLVSCWLFFVIHSFALWLIFRFFLGLRQVSLPKCGLASLIILLAFVPLVGCIAFAHSLLGWLVLYGFVFGGFVYWIVVVFFDVPDRTGKWVAIAMSVFDLLLFIAIGVFWIFMPDVAARGTHGISKRDYFVQLEREMRRIDGKYDIDWEIDEDENRRLVTIADWLGGREIVLVSDDLFATSLSPAEAVDLFDRMMQAEARNESQLRLYTMRQDPAGDGTNDPLASVRYSMWGEGLDQDQARLHDLLHHTTGTQRLELPIVPEYKPSSDLHVAADLLLSEPELTQYQAKMLEEDEELLDEDYDDTVRTSYGRLFQTPWGQVALGMRVFQSARDAAKVFYRNKFSYPHQGYYGEDSAAIESLVEDLSRPSRQFITALQWRDNKGFLQINFYGARLKENVIFSAKTENQRRPEDNHFLIYMLDMQQAKLERTMGK